jgi:pyruvate carboxylase
VITLQVAVGDAVESGQTVGSIEAMKMESPVRVQRDGHVERIHAPSGTRVEPGDLILVLGG